MGDILPKSVMISGRRFRIELSDELQGEDGENPETNHWGDSNTVHRRIRVASAAPSDQHAQILWHEFVHMVWGVAGTSEVIDEKTEEALVLALEHAWPDVVKLVNSIKRAKSNKKKGRPEGATPNLKTKVARPRRKRNRS